MIRHRKIEIGRGVWGVASLAAPRRVLDLTGGDPEDKPSRVVMRVLGARQVAQAVLSGVSPDIVVVSLPLYTTTDRSTTASDEARGRLSR